MSWRRLVGAGVMAGVLGAATPSPAVAWCRSTTETSIQAPGQGCSECATSGLPLAWKRPCLGVSIDVRNPELVDLAADTIRDVTERAFDAWTDVRCGAVTTIDVQLTEPSTCRRAAYEAEGGNVSTIAFLPDWDTHDPPLGPTTFALTFVWFDTGSGEIYDADILLNPSLGPYADCSDAGCESTDAGPAAIDLGNVLTHEVGHFLGFAHSDLAGSTMYCDGLRGEASKRTLDDDDRAGYCAAYPEPAEGRCDHEPRGGLDLDCEDGVGVSPAGGGCAIAGPPSARTLAVSFSTIGAPALLLLRARRRSPPARPNARTSRRAPCTD